MMDKYIEEEPKTKWYRSVLPWLPFLNSIFEARDGNNNDGQYRKKG